MFSSPSKRRGKSWGRCFDLSTRDIFAVWFFSLHVPNYSRDLLDDKGNIENMCLFQIHYSRVTNHMNWTWSIVECELWNQMTDVYTVYRPMNHSIIASSHQHNSIWSHFLFRKSSVSNGLNLPLLFLRYYNFFCFDSFFWEIAQSSVITRFPAQMSSVKRMKLKLAFQCPPPFIPGVSMPPPPPSFKPPPVPSPSDVVPMASDPSEQTSVPVEATSPPDTHAPPPPPVFEAPPPPSLIATASADHSAPPAESAQPPVEECAPPAVPSLAPVAPPPSSPTTALPPPPPPPPPKTVSSPSDSSKMVVDTAPLAALDTNANGLKVSFIFHYSRYTNSPSFLFWHTI